MQVRTKKEVSGILGILFSLVLVFVIYKSYPLILNQVIAWQREFNQQISASLNNISQHHQQAGLGLMLISFIYGVFHAIGPGHGKFILSSYLALEKIKIPKTIKITLLAASVQGLVAVALVTILIVVLTLSRHHFNLTLTWVERGSFVIMILFGLYWIVQSFTKAKSIKPIFLKPANMTNTPLVLPVNNMVMTSAHFHSAHCNCKHKHLPSSQEIEQLKDWKSVLMVVMSIGMRPCTGAVLVLFLAYMLDIYAWGVASALIMAVGTGITLTLFALFVLFSRNKAIQTSRWYFSWKTNRRLMMTIKLFMGLLLIGMGIVLFHSSLLDNTNLLFR